MRKFTLSLLVLLVSVFFLAQSASSQDILAVDRDGSGWTADFTDCWPYYMAALDAGGYTYTYFEVLDGALDGPDLLTMMDYDIIIWFTGEVWSGHETMTDTDEANLASYLDAGGNLFLSGQDWLWDRYPSAGVLGPGDFPYDYLGLVEVAQDNWVVESPDLADASGLAGSFAEGYTFQAQDIFTAKKEGLFIDDILSEMGTPAFELTSPTPVGNVAVQFEATKGFKTVFTALSFAAITSPNIQADLLGDIVDFFYGSPVVEDCQDFDSFAPGDYVAEVVPGWTTWSNNPGSAEDALITDVEYNSPMNSFVIEGASDLVQLFDPANITSGVYYYSNMMYVPTGFCGYYNLQKDVVPGVEWGFQVQFDVDGMATADAGAAAAAVFPFTFDEWHSNELIIDLENDLAAFYFDGVMMVEWPWSLGTFGTAGAMTLGGANYYAWASAGNSPMCYFDDICFEEYLPPAACEDFDELTAGMGVADQLGGYWTTWSGGAADDAMVTDVESNSPNNSFVVDAGTVDLIFQFDDVALDAGKWLYSNYIYVPAGFSGYFNVQSDPTPGVDWNLELFFDDGGTGSFAGQSTETFVYDQDTWFQVEILYDLDEGVAWVFFDGELIVEFVNTMTIGAIDYYGADSGGPPGAFYDDVCFEEYEIPAGDCEDFDALTAGVGVADQLGGFWTTWSGGAADDAMVSDVHSNSPDNSFVVDAGTVDLIYQFGVDPISTGQWLYSHYIYVPSGFSGYFNVQSEPTPGVDWNLELFFDDGGTGSFAGQATETFVYPQDTWLLIQINYDLDAGYGQVLIDGILLTEFVNAMTIGSIDYYGADSGGPPGAYYDDVCFGAGWLITGIEDPVAVANNDVAVYPNPATEKITIASENIIDEVRIYNNMGQLVYSGQFDNSQIMVNTSSFITGMYIVQITSGQAVEVRKLIIE